MTMILRKLLTDNLSGNRTVSITIDRKIPDTTIAIKSSASVLLYGVGSLLAPGFALYIAVVHTSVVGQQILTALNGDGLLQQFKRVDGQGTTIFVRDFQSDVDGILHKASEVVDRLHAFATQAEVDYHIARSDDTFTLG